MATKMKGKALSEEQERWWELGMRCLSVGVYEGEEEGSTVGVNLAR
jgi:ATP-dependent RNA helicase DHX29